MSYPYQVNSIETYQRAYKESVDNPEKFWEQVAGNFVWKKKWDQVLEWNFKEPDVKWFRGAQLNITENCLDRHLEKNGDTPAIIWEPNDPADKTRSLTYKELHSEVMRFAAVLKNNGIRKGDRVCIYMGMVPELTIALLACARVGAIHSVIFAGFSAKSIADRIQDTGAKMVIACDGALRGNKVIVLKPLVDEALLSCPGVEKVIVHKHAGNAITMQEGRDVWWGDETGKATPGVFVPAESMDAEDILFILYTSGSTGKPKGVVHTCAGYMIWVHYTFVNVFQYRPGQVHFCTADIGWITGHSYIVYGPLSAGATVLMYEGVPTYPDAGRYWEIVAKHKVNILYTAPTAIRSLMGYGLQPVQGKDLSSLQVLGSVGEPINEEAWHWFHNNIGGGKIPLVDTWWQTENGGILISNLAGITPSKPGYATLPLPGVQPVLVDDKGAMIEGNDISGNLCIRFPWPGMLRTIYGDHERCRQTYFATYENLYFSGDGCYRDENGLYRITGRVDDVLNISGHRIGTAEVENAINMHDKVIESAIVGYPHDIKGQAMYAYVILEHADEDISLLRNEILDTVTKMIGPIAKPDKIQFVTGLPKTRSGKIMRRILRKIAENDLGNLGDISTLLEPKIVDEIIKNRQ